MKNPLIKLAEKVELVYTELSKKSKDGGVTANDLLEASRDEGALLHDSFEWNDKVAGEAFRLNQARNLLHLITVEISSDPVRKVRGVQSVIVGVNRRTDRKYYTIDKIIKTPSLKEKALKQMVDEIQSLVNRYATYKEIYRVVNTTELKHLEKEITETLTL